MKALVTGASGFIGRHVVEKLIGRGYRVRGLVRKTSHVAPLNSLGIELCYGDLGDLDSLKRAASGVDVLFHTAAQVGDWGTRKQFYDSNVAGTRHILAAMSAAGVRKLLYFSSIAVYGRPSFQQASHIREEAPCRRNGDPYFDTKVEAENLVAAYTKENKIAVSILRPSIVYGPYDHKFIPRLVQAIRQGKMVLIDSGHHKAPIIYVEDVADLSVLAAERDEANGEVFNVSTDEGVMWSQFLTELAGQVKATPPTVSVPPWLLYYSGAVMESLWRAARAKDPPMMTRFGAMLLGGKWEYNMSKAKRVLGFRPRVGYKQGLGKTIQWMRQEQVFGV